MRTISKIFKRTTPKLTLAHRTEILPIWSPWMSRQWPWPSSIPTLILQPRAYLHTYTRDLQSHVMTKAHLMTTYIRT
jgi:hypothetical protein